MNLRFLRYGAGCLALLAVSFPMPAVAHSPSGSAITSFHHNGNGYLGVDFENLTSQQRVSLQIPQKEGVMIAAVDHDAPAGKAGLHSNDVILQMNGKKAQNAEELRESLHKMSPGDAVSLEVLRKGQPLEFHVVLADRKAVEEHAWSEHYTVPNPQLQPTSGGNAAATDGVSTSPVADPKAASATPSASQTTGQTGLLGAVPSELGKTFSSNGGLMSFIPGTAPYTGITVDLLTPQLAEFFGLKGTTGLLVKSVDPNSPGSRAGVQAGDVIRKANDTPMTTHSRWSHALRENRHEAIKLEVLRNRRPRILLLTLAATKS